MVPPNANYDMSLSTYITWGSYQRTAQLLTEKQIRTVDLYIHTKVIKILISFTYCLCWHKVYKYIDIDIIETLICNCNYQYDTNRTRTVLMTFCLWQQQNVYIRKWLHSCYILPCIDIITSKYCHCYYVIIMLIKSAAAYQSFTGQCLIFHCGGGWGWGWGGERNILLIGHRVRLTISYAWWDLPWRAGVRIWKKRSYNWP